MRITALLLLVPVVISWYCAGFWLLRSTGHRLKNREDLLLATMTGFGVIGNIITFFGIFQILTTSALLLLSTVFILSGFLGPFRCLFLLKDSNPRRFLSITWGTVLVFMIIFFIRSLLPPTGIDSLMYHLSVPKLYLHHGGFYAIPWNVQSDLPMLGEMNFLFGIAYKNPVVCRLIAFTTGLFLCGMIYVISCKFINNSRFISLALLIYVSHTTTTANFSHCNVDILTASFTLAAFYCLKKAVDNNRSVNDFLPGLFFLCFTVQTKPFGILIVPVAWAYLVLVMHKKRQLQWKILAATLLLPIIAGSIWYIKSCHFTGLPIYGMHKLKSIEGAASSSDTTVLSTISKKSILAICNFVTAPWSYSLFPLRHRMDSFGPLFIAILPFSLFINKKTRFYHLLFWGVGIWTMFITVSTLRGLHGNMSIRYMTASVAFFSTLAAYTVSLTESPFLKRTLLYSVWIFVSISMLVTVKRYRYDIAAVLTGASSRNYLIKNYDLYPILDHINNDLPNNVYIKAFYCFGTFYIDRRYSCSTISFPDTKTMIKKYQAEGVTHILTNNIFQPQSNEIKLSENYGLSIVCHKNGYYLYALPKW